MQKVFTSSDLGEATLVRDALEQEGIACMIKNEVLTGGLSFSLGYTNTWPEVWILNEGDVVKAQEIVSVWSSQDQK